MSEIIVVLDDLEDLQPTRPFLRAVEDHGPNEHDSAQGPHTARSPRVTGFVVASPGILPALRRLPHVNRDALFLALLGVSVYGSLLVQLFMSAGGVK